MERNFGGVGPKSKDPGERGYKCCLEGTESGIPTATVGIQGTPASKRLSGRGEPLRESCWEFE